MTNLKMKNQQKDNSEKEHSTNYNYENETSKKLQISKGTQRTTTILERKNNEQGTS